MPKRKQIKKPVSDKKPQDNYELDLDALTDSLAGKTYGESADSSEPEPVCKTSVDIPESLNNKIMIDVTTNKIKKSGPTSKSCLLYTSDAADD